jgi:hypothetical protein
MESMEQTDPQVLASIVTLACRAPSVHNSQPWHLIAEDGVLRLFFDPHRAPHATDPSGREAIISCGALLDHLSVAAAAVGWKTHVAQFPNPSDLNHLATVTFHPGRPVTDADAARAEAIDRRRTDRLPFDAPTDRQAVESLLRNAADPEKAVLTVLPDSARPLLAEASELTEALRRKDTYYHAELQWWTADSEKSDGMPYGVLVSAEDRDRVDVARAFPAGEHSGARPEVARDHSMIVILSTFGDSRREALECGEALSAVLLEATLADLATCTLTHLTELPESRAIIRRLSAGHTDPQLLIRVGQVPESGEVSRTPRRPVAEVLAIRGSGPSV